MTNREAFDTVKKHLLCQGRRSLSDGNCKFRGDGGLKCAIGILIPEDKYQPSWDASMSASIREVSEACGFVDLDKSMLASLQRMHDTRPVSEWASRLEEIEREYSRNF